MDRCVNPYNFVRPGKPAKKDKPKGHHKFDGLSGKITCILKLITPIFISDPEKRMEIEEGENKGHKILEFFKVGNKPVIPPTGIKGMIRSVVETASNSCFSVFDGGRLDYRTTRFRPIAGIVKKLPEGRNLGEIRAMEFARIEYSKIPSGFQTGSTIYAKLRKMSRFDTIVTDAKSSPESGYTKGILKMTGENIEGKNKERVFYSDKGTYNFGKKEKDDYDAILRAQIKEERITSKSYQHKELKVKDLIYFEDAEGERVKNISRVQLPRIKYDKSQDDRLLSDKCKDTKKLCPACRLFGTVIEKDTKKKTESFAGNVSFSVCELKGEKLNLITGQILKILSSAKPTSCNFYLIDPVTPQKVRDYDGRAIEIRGKGFAPNPDDTGRMELRGRKFYWHKPYEKEDKDALKRYTTTKEELKSNNQKLGLTSSVELLLPPAEFTFTVDFDNLDESELGLLLWSLEIEGEMAHKLGMGKPLGLGSVKIKIEKLEVINRIKRYTEIFSSGIQVKTSEKQNYIDKFKKKLEEENSKKFDEIPNISDLKKIMNLQNPPQNNVKYPGDFHWFAGHKNLPLPTIEETVTHRKTLPDCRS